MQTASDLIGLSYCSTAAFKCAARSLGVHAEVQQILVDSRRNNPGTASAAFCISLTAAFSSIWKGRPTRSTAVCANLPRRAALPRCAPDPAAAAAPAIRRTGHEVRDTGAYDRTRARAAWPAAFRSGTLHAGADRGPGDESMPSAKAHPRPIPKALANGPGGLIVLAAAARPLTGRCRRQSQPLPITETPIHAGCSQNENAT